jgi:hypothetical protein
MDGTTIIGSGSPTGVGLDWAFRGIDDFNGDGKGDILLRHSSGIVYIWLMSGTTIIGSGSPSGTGPEWDIQ